MDSGEEFSILMVHLLLPPFRDYSGHLISHQNGTSFSWDSQESDPHPGRLLLSQSAESPPRNGSSQVAAWSTSSALGMVCC